MKALFARALDQPTGARAAWLDAHCDDAALREEVTALLAAHAEAEASGRFDRPVLKRAGTGGGDPMAGARVGPWRLEERIGTGGMGAVYRARRADGAYDREVAVKLLRPGPDAAALAGRLHAERQILARLEHPGIARLYDGGVTDDGLPYFALEYVEGWPLTAYAREHTLLLRDRLRLFLQVCDAVAYAHRHLVVHRDLKPSNVLVTAGGEARLLDFGIARLLEDDADALATQTNARLLTPAYAAPEQVRGGAVTTATDVYALGVVLYELLAERRPYDLAGKTAAQVERIVGEVVPPPPSESAPPEGRAALRGDLDTVVLKALEKEPERRYASAEALADDLRRHLAGLPVEARPATAGYRARKFVARHRAAVSAAALVGVGAAALVGFYTARLAAERDRAQTEADKAAAVSLFLQEMLGAPDPSNEGRDVRVADVLDRAAAQLDTAAAVDPAAAAALRFTLGATYRGLGLYDEAEPLLRRALAERRRLAHGADAETASTLSELAYVLRLQNDLAGADRLGREALAHYRALHGEHHPLVATAYNDLAATARDRGDLQTAEAFMRRALDTDRALLDPDDPDLAVDYANLAHVLADQGRPAEAEPLMRHALAIDQANAPGGRSADVALDLSSLASFLTDLRRYDEAEGLYREALALRRELLGPEHPSTLNTQMGLARALTERGTPDAALPLYDAALAGFRAALGPAHLRVAQALTGRAACLAALGRSDAARFDYEAAVAMWAEVAPDNINRATALVGLGALLTRRGEERRAAPLLREAVRLRQQAFGAGHPSTAAAEAALQRALG